MAKIAFFEVKDWEKEYFKQKISTAEVIFFNGRLSQENVHLVKDCGVISIFVDSQITKEMIDMLPDLAMIATRSTGFDNIDIA